jgi:hypothetical protein
MKAKILNPTVVIIALAIIGVIFSCAWIGSLLNQRGFTIFAQQYRGEAFYTSDITNSAAPKWVTTNAIPLQPDQAVRIAMKHANQQYADNSEWRLVQLELERQFDDFWVYKVHLSGPPKSGGRQAIVRVLMDGEIWSPRIRKSGGRSNLPPMRRF